MRKYIGKYILLFVICLAVGLSVFLFISSRNDRAEGQRFTLMNRVANEISSTNVADIDSRLSSLLSSNNWAQEYGKDNVPVDVRYISADSGEGAYAMMGDPILYYYPSMPSIYCPFHSSLSTVCWFEQ